LAVLQHFALPGIDDAKQGVNRRKTADSSPIFFPLKHFVKAFRVHALGIFQQTPVFLLQGFKSETVGGLGVSKPYADVRQVRAGKHENFLFPIGEGLL
jgi:hypothetical protein